MKLLTFPLLLLLVCLPLRGEPDTGFGSGEGVNGEVLCIAVQKDGKAVIGGLFAAVNGVQRQNLARLNPDGSLDREFISQAVMGPNGVVAAVIVLPDGGILAGGDFNTVGNLHRADLVKFHADGTADAGFGAQEGGVATNGSVAALALRPDGSIVVGGNFTTFYGKPRRGIALLNADGSVAEGPKQAAALSGSVAALGVDSGGNTFAAGKFSDPGQTARGILKLAR